MRALMTSHNTKDVMQDRFNDHQAGNSHITAATNIPCLALARFC
jgi:hypothetical protein